MQDLEQTDAQIHIHTEVRKYRWMRVNFMIPFHQLGVTISWQVKLTRKSSSELMSERISATAPRETILMNTGSESDPISPV